MDLEVTRTDILRNISTAGKKLRLLRSSSNETLGKTSKRGILGLILSTSKVDNIKQGIKRLDEHILGVSEVRWSGNGDFCSNDYRVIYSGGETPGREGVEFIINK